MRIIVFGCSYSRYYWPTWADIMRWSNPDIEVINFGLFGIGNQRIFWRMNECLVKDFFDIDDQIVTVWSSWHREDRLLANGWTWGNIFNSDHYSEHYIEKYWNEDFDIIKNLNAITAANALFDISHNGTMLHVGAKERYDGCKVPELLNYESRLSNYQHYVDRLPQLVGFNRNSAFNGRAYDKHPDVLCHYDYYKRIQQNMPWLKDADQNLIDTLQHDIIHGITPDLRYQDLNQRMVEITESIVPGFAKQNGLVDGKFTDPVELVC